MKASPSLCRGYRCCALNAAWHLHYSGLPSELYLDAKIFAVVSAGATNDFADIVVHGFNGACQVGVEGTVNPKLLVQARLQVSPARCPGDGHSRYHVDGVGDRLAPTP